MFPNRPVIRFLKSEEPDMLRTRKQIRERLNEPVTQVPSSCGNHRKPVFGITGGRPNDGKSGAPGQFRQISQNAA